MAMFLQTKRDECVVMHGMQLFEAVCPSLVSFNTSVLSFFLFTVAECVGRCTSVCTAGPEAEQCQKLIEAHKACLRKEGFNV